MTDIDLIRLAEEMSKLNPWFMGAWIVSGVVFALLSVVGMAIRFWPTTEARSEPPPIPPIVQPDRAIGNGVTIVNHGVVNLQINDFGEARVNRLQATDSNGAQGAVEFVLLHSSAIWTFGSDNSFI